MLIIHKDPDGDAAGAGLAMYEMLKNMGKTPSIFCVDEFPDPFYFLPNNEELIHELQPQNFDLGIILDCGAD